MVLKSAPPEVSVILVSEIATAGTERSVAEEEFMTGGGRPRVSTPVGCWMPPGIGAIPIIVFCLFTLWAGLDHSFVCGNYIHSPKIHICACVFVIRFCFTSFLWVKSSALKSSFLLILSVVNLPCQKSQIMVVVVPPWDTGRRLPKKVFFYLVPATEQQKGIVPADWC